MIHDDPNEPETRFNVGDLVRPVGAPDVRPKRVERVITTYEDDFGQPLGRTDYIVNGNRFLESELTPDREQDSDTAGQGKGGSA